MKQQDLEKLLSKMSLHEKLCQMWQVQQFAFDKDGVMTGGADKGQNYNLENVKLVGSTLNLYGLERIRRVQEDHLANDPNHIPMLFMADVIHGLSTIFPVPLAYSCSFDTDLVEKAYRVVGTESAAVGMHISFFPMMDLSRDPRWGRVVEGCGEDPYLDAQMCRAIVKGFQGEGLDKKDTIGACVKHFAAYGGAEGGRDYNTVNVGERTLRQFYLPGYKGGIDAGAAMVMTSYNVVDGVPSNCNKWLVREVLKGEWGFEGVVITDLFATASMSSHGIGIAHDEDNGQYRGKVSLEAGIDIDMGSDLILKVESLIEKGEMDEALVDEACMRILKLKNALGLFENPYTMASQEECDRILGCEAHMSIARKLSQESCVLLKNEDEILPLTEKSGKVAFIGPAVNTDKVNSTWTLFATSNANTLRKEIEKRYPDRPFFFAQGCSFLGREQVRESERFGLCDEQTREQTISEAVELAKTVDTVVLTLGEAYVQSGESRSRSNIRIPDVQLELYRRVRAVNENVVVLVYNGRPLDLSEIQDAKAILDVWFLGSQMQEAIVDLIFGQVSPSGKITMSFPSNVNQIPVYYNHLRTDHRQPYCWSEYIDDSTSQPLYPFGYGLTYSALTYSDTKVDKEYFGPTETVTATVDITNEGKYDVTEVVQMYIIDSLATISRPVKELKGFQRVEIPAGKTVTVSFEITEPMLRYYNIDMEYVSDAGRFGVKIAPHSGFSENEYTFFHLKK